MKSFKTFLTEMYAFPEAPNVQQVEKMEVPQNVPVMGGESKIPPVNFKTPQSGQTQCDVNGICKVIRKYESAGNEQKILAPYKDSKGLLTIAHGHLITPQSAKIFSNLGIDPNILNGQGKLTPKQADDLLSYDVSKRIPEIQKLVPNFSKYSTDLQAQLASEHFRGMLGKSPKALQMLNTGNYVGAATEYLNAADYRDSVKNKTGIASRMEALSNAIKTEATRQQPRQSASQTTSEAQKPSTAQTSTSH